MREIGHHGQHPGAREAEAVELLPVELRVAQRQIARGRVGRELAAPPEAQLDEQVVHADEILRRRDVVVDERHPIRQRERRPAMPWSRSRNGAAAGCRDGSRRPARGSRGEILEPLVRGLDEDVRLVAGAAQHALDAEHLVADRIAVSERGQHLMDGAARLMTAEHGSVGMRARRDVGGGRQFAPAPAAREEPGSGSIGCAAAVARQRSNMSRYLRSITGHA